MKDHRDCLRSVIRYLKNVESDVYNYWFEVPFFKFEIENNTLQRESIKNLFFNKVFE